MSELRLIGLAGAAGSGKDTVAGMLAAYGYRQYAMAGPLKSALSALGIEEPVRELKEQLLPGKPFSYRKAAQTLGTDWARNLDPAFWTSLAKSSLGFGKWVVSDIRFPNEVSMVQELGGEIWHVEGRAGILVGDTATHVSTQKLPIQTSDIRLLNDSSLVVLRDRVSRALEK